VKKLLLLSLLFGCVTAGRSLRPPVSTINVWNETGVAVDIYYDNRKLGTSMRMRECIPIRVTDGNPVGQLRIEVTSERPFYTPVVDLRESWSIRLGPSPHSRNFDAMSLTEAPRCDIMEVLDAALRRPGDKSTH
jgi:hypothetical protein